jgi:hypothetical protein
MGLEIADAIALRFPQRALHQEVTGKLRTSGHDVILLVVILTDLEKSL